MSEQANFSLTTTSGDYAQYLAQLNDVDFWNYAAQLAQPPAALTPAQEPALLLCALENVTCLLPWQQLREILPAPPHYGTLPLSPEWMPGIMTWRGEIIPVFDLFAYLLQQPAHWRADDTLLITEYAGRVVGWLVADTEAIPASLLEIDGVHPEQSGWYKLLAPGLVIQVYDRLPLLDLGQLITEATQRLEVVAAYEQ